MESLQIEKKLGCLLQFLHPSFAAHYLFSTVACGSTCYLSMDVPSVWLAVKGSEECEVGHHVTDALALFAIEYFRLV